MSDLLSTLATYSNNLSTFLLTISPFFVLLSVALRNRNCVYVTPESLIFQSVSALLRNAQVWGTLFALSDGVAKVQILIPAVAAWYVLHHQAKTFTPVRLEGDKLEPLLSVRADGEGDKVDVIVEDKVQGEEKEVEAELPITHARNPKPTQSNSPPPHHHVWSCNGDWSNGPSLDRSLFHSITLSTSSSSPSAKSLNLTT